MMHTALQRSLPQNPLQQFERQFCSGMPHLSCNYLMHALACLISLRINNVEDRTLAGKRTRQFSLGCWN